LPAATIATTITAIITVTPIGALPGNGSAGGLPGLHRCPGAIALGVELQNRRVADEAVDCGHRHYLVGENSLPRAEGLIAGDEEAPALVALGDQLQVKALIAE
jgi:hypothetical protein